MKVRMLPGVLIVAGSLTVIAVTTPVLVSAAGADADTPSSTGRTAAATDNTITSSVKARLASAQGLDAQRITVNTVDGVVRLEGTVRNESQRALALQAAKEVRGVTAVSDELRAATTAP